MNTHCLKVTEIDYEADQFLTLGVARFKSEQECIEFFDRFSDIGTTSQSANREYKLDRYSDGSRVDEKFIAPATASALLRADLTHLHDQADAALAAEVSAYLSKGPA